MKTVWLVELDLGGYPLVCISETAEKAQLLMCQEYRKWCRNNQPMHPDCPRPYSKWNVIAEHFDSNCREILLDEVVWP